MKIINLNKKMNKRILLSFYLMAILTLVLAPFSYGFKIQDTSACNDEGYCEMTLTKTADQTEVNPGDLVTYTLTLTNTGTGYCTGGGVKLRDYIPDGLTFVSASPDLDKNKSDYIQWNFGEIPAGEVNIGTVTFSVNEDVACGSEITNKAKYWSDQTDWGDYVYETINVACQSEPSCGDGTIDEGEQCDDGNTISGDGCDSNCEIESEERQLKIYKYLDANNNNEYDNEDTIITNWEFTIKNIDSNTTISKTTNNEGYVIFDIIPGDNYKISENLTDGWQHNYIYAHQHNFLPDYGEISNPSGTRWGYIGNGYITFNSGVPVPDFDYKLYFGNYYNQTPEPYCGDGTINEGEQCDDGNTISGDGCDSNCEIESDEDLCSTPTDVMLVMDRSQSMEDDTILGGDIQPMQDSKDAAKYFVSLMDNTKDQVGLVSYATDASLDHNLTTDFNSINSSIDGMVPYGWTNIGAAVNLATNELTTNSRNDALPVMIVMTDGNPNVDENGNVPNEPGGQTYALAEAQIAKDLGYKIYTIGLGSAVKADFLKTLASSADNYYYAPNSDDLEYIYKQIAYDICEYASISGCKYSDVNNNKIIDNNEPLIENWEIVLSGDNLNQDIITATEDGCYSFYGLEPGTYTISEGNNVENQPFIQTYPNNPNNYLVTVASGDNAAGYDFANYFPYCGNNIVDEGEQCDDGNTISGDGCDSNCEIEEGSNPYCGDGIINQDSEECDGTAGVGEHQQCSDNCILEDLTYCGDGIVQSPNGEGINEECDGTAGVSDNNYQCSSQCVRECVTNCGGGGGPVNPVLTIEKTALQEYTNQDGIVDYTINVKNIGATTGYNLKITDTLPTGLEYYATTTNGIWELGDIATNETKTVSYQVLFSDVTIGDYVNTAKAEVDNGSSVEDTATVEVRVPTVYADEYAPLLAIDKNVNMSFTNPGGEVTYTVTVTNVGTDDIIAKNTILIDRLPKEFYFKNNNSTVNSWKLGDLAQGESKTVTYDVVVRSDTKAGFYKNLAITTADNTPEVSASVNLEVRNVTALGYELPDTNGATDSILTIILGLLTLSAGYLLVELKKTNSLV